MLIGPIVCCVVAITLAAPARGRAFVVLALGSAREHALVSHDHDAVKRMATAVRDALADR